MKPFLFDLRIMVMSYEGGLLLKEFCPMLFTSLPIKNKHPEPPI